MAINNFSSLYSSHLIKYGHKIWAIKPKIWSLYFETNKIVSCETATRTYTFKKAGFLVVDLAFGFSPGYR